MAGPIGGGSLSPGAQETFDFLKKQDLARGRGAMTGSPNPGVTPTNLQNDPNFVQRPSAVPGSVRSIDNQVPQNTAIPGAQRVADNQVKAGGQTMPTPTQPVPNPGNIKQSEGIGNRDATPQGMPSAIAKPLTSPVTGENPGVYDSVKNIASKGYKALEDSPAPLAAAAGLGAGWLLSRRRAG
jgi:uncharacterized protein (TIGR03382 family)